MKRNLLIVAAALVISGFGLTAHRMYGKERHKATGTEPAAATTVPAKPLSEHVKKGVEWLVAHQQKNGGWGQGEEAQPMGRGMDNLKDTANVADTCVATLALLRAGHTPSRGAYQANVRKGVDFVCREIEQSDEKSLYVTNLRGTRVQGKLGPYADTFLSALVLAEVRNQIPDAAGKNRVIAALDKVMHKIERNQREDGTWDNTGWAPVLSQGLAGKAINRAAQEGAKVDEAVRARVERNARNQVDASTGVVKATPTSAGVPLYSSAATLGAMQESDNTNQSVEKELKSKLNRSTTSAQDRKAIAGRLTQLEANKKDLNRARAAVVDRLDDRQFMAGFGSNGGEEFLSYLSIGESLVAEGGAEWQKWDRSMTENLNRIQNNDGSWSGHHCITGRTFCTAAALMVLTIDRAPRPVADKFKRS